MMQSGLMAEESLKKQEKLNCSICQDTYTDPKLLQCFHVYCLQCLGSLIVQDQHGQVHLKCPECQQHTPIIPDREGSGLLSAFHIKQLLEFQDCFQIIKKRSFSPSDGSLNSAVDSMLEPLEKQEAELQQALKSLDTCSGNLSSQQAVIKGNIQVAFHQLQKVLHARETELKDQLDKIIQGKHKILDSQMNSIRANLVRLNTCVKFIRDSLMAGNTKDDSRILAKVEEFTTSFQSVFLKCSTEHGFKFSVAESMVFMCHNYGKISVQGSPDPSKSYIIGNGGDRRIEEASTVILQAVGFDSEISEEPITLLECELVSETTGSTTSCSVERRERGQYKISYQPMVLGAHLLHVRVYGEHIAGSPFSVTAIQNSPVLRAPFLTVSLSEEAEPHGVAINLKGNMVVTEWARHSVSVFSQTGEKLLSFGSRGSGEGEFRHPRGIAVDGGGNILVADSGNCSIQKFTSEGCFLQRVGAVESGPLQFAYPADIAYNASNDKVYVVDNNNHNIQVLNSDLTFSGTFGGKGRDEGQFSSPHGIACDSTGAVYVADSYNHRIQVFTAEGEFMRMFGKNDRGKELNLPYCLAVDASSSVYVSESCGNSVSIFTSGGQFLNSFGSRGVRPGEFDRPCGLAVDGKGMVCVCDCKNNCVQLFSSSCLLLF